MNTLETELYFKQGFEIILNNAKEQIESAKILAKEKKYAPAIALLIIAAEEAMKGQTAYTQLFFPNAPEIDFSKYYKDHKTKLEGIRGTILITELLDKSFEIITNEIINKKEDEDTNTAYNRGIKKFTDYLTDLTENGNEEFDNELEWWKHAKGLKEDCLYVRKNGKSWHNPQKTTKKLYDKTLLYVEQFVNNVDYINNIDTEKEPYKKITKKFKDFITTNIKT